MPFKVYFDGPNHYEGKYNFYKQGGSPTLLKRLISIIEENRKDLLEINLCWYLFNNNILHEFLKEISLSGIKVNIVTIPLEGYDDTNPKKLIGLEESNQYSLPVTKYDLAKSIFGEIKKSKEYVNYNIYFFPHLYVRSSKVKKFSRGKLPYSMHLKAAYLKKKNGSVIILSSSNLAVRDLVKHESMVVIEDEPLYDNVAKFFSDIIHHSINIKEYNSGFDMSCNTCGFIESANNDYSFFTAPFYFDSANYLESKIISLINKAQSRIIICAQHLAAFNYGVNSSFHSQKTENEKRGGILGAIIERAKNGVRTTCISQTFAPPKDKLGVFKNYTFRSPSNTSNFQHFFKEISETGNTEYFVNENMHSKYIIVDDTLIFCTYNFTPTQFVFLDKVEIEKFDEMPGISYKGVHCEVSGHVVIKDDNLINAFLETTDFVCRLPETIKVL